MQQLQAVFEVLAKAKLSLNLDKCNFAQEVQVLGFAVDSMGFRLPPEKVQAILDFPRPPIIMRLRRFLGLVNFFHLAIPKMAVIEVPLTDLMRGAKK